MKLKALSNNVLHVAEEFLRQVDSKGERHDAEDFSSDNSATRPLSGA